jgi:voltage-gated potassium channel Kch
MVESLNPGSFRESEHVSAPLQEEGRQYFTLAYFSLVTLTSVGYGDIIPGSGIVRSLAVVEAIIGQFYIAVLIGELIGKRVSQAMAGRPSGETRSG